MIVTTINKHPLLGQSLIGRHWPPPPPPPLPLPRLIRRLRVRHPRHGARRVRQGERTLPLQGGLRRSPMRPVHLRLLRIPQLRALQLQQERDVVGDLRYHRQVLLPLQLRREDLQPVRPRLLRLSRVYR
jgi:hypothetical protein